MTMNDTDLKDLEKDIERAEAEGMPTPKEP